MPCVQNRDFYIKFEPASTSCHLQAGIKGLVLAAMVYRSVGVIFGDLGTSPMYIYPSTFDHPPSRSDVMGALSLILWTLTLLALVKYVLIVLWANDDGEGDFPSPHSWVWSVTTQV